MYQGYSGYTGYHGYEGYSQPSFPELGCTSPCIEGTFEEILSQTMNKRLNDFYMNTEPSWRKLVRIRRGIHDYKQYELQRISGV